MCKFISQASCKTINIPIELLLDIIDEISNTVAAFNCVTTELLDNKPYCARNILNPRISTLTNLHTKLQLILKGDK